MEVGVAEDLARELPARCRAAVSFSAAIIEGDAGIGKLLVFSQVALSFQLPFAIWPLIQLTGDPVLMGRHANGIVTKSVAWSLFAAITVANVWLVARLL